MLAYQGGLTALAAVLEQVMTPAVVAAMTAVGGLLVVAIGLRLLGLARIRVANLLPAVPLAPWPPAWSQPSDSVKNEGGRQWAT